MKIREPYIFGALKMRLRGWKQLSFVIRTFVAIVLMEKYGSYFPRKCSRDLTY